MLDLVKPENDGKELPVDDVLKARIVSFKPLLDFFAPLKPVPIIDPATGQVVVEGGRPKMGMSREPICSTHDFSDHPQVTHIFNGPGMVYDFFSQMQPDDRKKYEDFIAQAMQHAKERQQPPTGLKLATTDEVESVARAHGKR